MLDITPTLPRPNARSAPLSGALLETFDNPILRIRVAFLRHLLQANRPLMTALQCCFGSA